MRVGLLTTSFPRFAGDVAGHFVLGFARALVACGHKVEVLAPEPADSLPPPRFDGIEVHHVPYLRPRTWQRTFYGAGVPDNLRGDPRAWLGLAPFTAALFAHARARCASWDAIVSHFALPSGLIGAALPGGKPHLCVLHSADVHALTRVPGGAALTAAIATGSSALWFVSERARAQLIARAPARMRAQLAGKSLVHAMGIDAPEPVLEDRSALRARLGIERFALLTLCRLVPVKGLPPAVRALAHRDDLEWLIAGEGPDHAQLAALARTTRLRVRLLGHVQGADKRAWLHAADAFVLPSRVLPSGRSEGVPTALIEAMAVGLPVIASDAGAIGELVQPERTGTLFSTDSAHGLEHAIDDLRRDPARARVLAERARELASQRTWSALAAMIESLLREPAAERPACVETASWLDQIDDIAAR